jgi:hypothetical protein
LPLSLLSPSSSFLICSAIGIFGLISSIMLITANHTLHNFRIRVYNPASNKNVTHLFFEDAKAKFDKIDAQKQKEKKQIIIQLAKDLEGKNPTDTSLEDVRKYIVAINSKTSDGRNAWFSDRIERKTGRVVYARTGKIECQSDFEDGDGGGDVQNE